MSKIITRNNENVEDQISLLINNRLILCYSGGDRSSIEVINIYNNLLITLGKIPTYQSVLEGVRSHNWDVFYDAACMKYDYTYGVNTGYGETACEEIHEFACDIEEDYNETDNATIDFFVGYVLRTNMLSCEIEIQDNIFHEEGMIAVKHIRDVKIIANDCQNILFYEFIEGGVIGYGDVVNYYGTGMDLLIGEGR